MDQFYFFILRNDIPIYIVSVLGLFWYISQLIRAQRQLRVAIFSLERETNSQLRNTSIVVILILSGIIGGVYYVNSEIAPTLPARVLPTSTPDIFRTPLSSPTPLLTRQPTSTPPLVPTITLASNPGEPAPNPAEEATPDEAATAVGTPLPPPTPSVGCTVQLNIIEPRNGSVVAGTITFNGTADFDDFGYYTLKPTAHKPVANGPRCWGATSNSPSRMAFWAASISANGSLALISFVSQPPIRHKILLPNA